MNPFQPVCVGESNLMVTPLGLGCGPLASRFTDVQESEAVATVRWALQADVRLFDTAPLYGLGKSETRLGKAVQGVHRDSFVLASKVGRMLVPDDNAPLGEHINTPPLPAVFDYSYDAVMRSYESSLRRSRRATEGCRTAIPPRASGGAVDHPRQSLRSGTGRKCADGGLPNPFGILVRSEGPPPFAARGASPRRRGVNAYPSCR